MTTGKSYLISIKYLFLSLIILFSSCDFNSKEKELIGIVADVSEVKLVYEQNEKLDMSGLIVTALYDDESEEVISDYKLDMNDETELKESGIYKITVFYEGFNTCFEYVVNEIIVEEELKDVIETEPIVVEKLYLNVETDFDATKDTVELYSEEFNNLKPLKVTAVSNKAGVMTFEWYITFHGGVNTTILQTTNKKVEADQTCEDSYVIKANPYMKALYTCDVKMIAGEETQTVTTVSFEQKQIMPDTGLPVLEINTKDNKQITSKTDKIKGNMTIYDTGNIVNQVELKIALTGNATSNYEKKPYKIKLEEPEELLGMPFNRDWRLLANYCDKTLMRTSFGFKTSEMLNMEWTPKAEYVELIINNEFLGNYQLSETVKRDINRVNVADDGFLIEQDARYLGEECWFVSDRNVPYSFKYPDTDELNQNSSDIQFINNYINELETILYSEDYIAFDEDNGYSQYVDIDSFVRWFLVNNILYNKDMNKFISKFDKKSESKLKMCGVWDFEWSIGIGWYDGTRPNPNHYYITPMYYSRMLEDSKFLNKIKEIWENEFYPNKELLLNLFSELSSRLEKSQELNFKRWKIMNNRVSVGGIPLGSFSDEVECDKQYLIEHIEWLSLKISEL